MYPNDEAELTLGMFEKFGGTCPPFSVQKSLVEETLSELTTSDFQES